MQLKSSAFATRQAIPVRYTGEGADESPPLNWAGVPSAAKSLVLIVDDPDAPSPKHPAKEPWVHWVLFNIPVAISDLPAAIARERQLRSLGDAEQGRNSWPDDHLGYRGPMPPPGSGPHRYRFQLYALDTRLSLTMSAPTKQDVLHVMHGHVLDEAQLIGVYERS